jgi:hypothetical protein
MPDPSFSIIESYAEGKAVCVAEISSASSGDFDLVFFCVPGMGKANHDAANAPQVHCQPFGSDGHQDGVFLGIAKTVQVPEGNIPSFVGLKARNDGLDFVRRFLGKAINPISEELFGLGEREVCKLGNGAITCYAGSENGVVKDGPQIIDDVENYAGRFIKERLIKSNYMAIVAALDISLDKVGPLFVVRECSDPRFKITKVIFCPL